MRHYRGRRKFLFATIQIVCIFCLSLLLSNGPAMAQSSTETIGSVSSDPAVVKSGRAKAQGCSRCHGRSGIQRLALDSNWTGSVGLYVMKQLTELRDGIIHHSIMTEIARDLSDEDIAQISAWVQSVSAK